MNSPYLEAALYYHRQGYSAIPVKPGQKFPPLVKWDEYQHERPTEAQIRDWWDSWPNANVAIVTGQVSGITVIDFDGQNGRCRCFCRADILSSQECFAGHAIIPA